MKLVAYLLLFCCTLFGCKSNELPSEQISDISVVREASSNSNTPQTSQVKANAVTAPSSTYQQSNARYHIIVASYSMREKNKAQSLVADIIRDTGFPASLLYSSERYRVSIESFTSETEAKAARDEYRIELEQKDIWVHKVE